jgi:hypothetical protein
MQLGDVMARYSWQVDSLAAKIGAEPELVRNWLLVEELPDPHFMLRLYTTLFRAGTFEWLAFATAYNRGSS